MANVNREPWHMIFTDTITHFFFFQILTSLKLKRTLLSPSSGSSLVAQTVKNVLAMRETQV